MPPSRHCASQPVLSRARLREVVAAAVADDPTTWQQFSDLAEQVDLVRFTPLPLSLEELSKLWSTFFQAPYRLSVTYQASVVLLDGDLTPQPALPVLTRGIDAAALNIPVVTRVVADADPMAAIVPGTHAAHRGSAAARPVRHPGAARRRRGARAGRRADRHPDQRRAARRHPGGRCAACRSCTRA